MKKLIFTLSIVLIFSLACLSQVSHLTLIYDIEGNDFDYSVEGMVGTNDSLYIISNTPDGRGKFFRIDENGKGYKVIWEFDNVDRLPFSLIANDTVIYGTTRGSSNGGGAVFKYSLKDHSFEYIKKFTPYETREIQVKYITDSVLWLTSHSSVYDEGSIITLKKDGSEFKKIYDDTNPEKGQNPVDFVFYNDSIYIACYNGGGIPYPDGLGEYVSSGCFIRIKSDGTGYEMLVKGGDDKGTQPQSIIIRENKIYGLFAKSGSNWSLGGQFFRSNLNGTSYDSLGALSRRSLTKMLSTDSLIYGISFSQIFGINPYDGEIRIFDDLLNDPDFGYDMVTSPALLNGSVFISAQQGGPNRGGTILKWTNRDPEIKESQAKNSQTSTQIVLSELFTDPEGDRLTYDFEYDRVAVDLSESNGTLTVTPLKSGETEVKITAKDGWNGYKSYSLKVSFPTSVLKSEEDPGNLLLYPNPATSILNLGSETLESVEILTLNGKLIKSYKNPGPSINISTLEKGLYVIRWQKKGYFYSQKIIKY